MKKTFIIAAAAALAVNVYAAELMNAENWDKTDRAAFQDGKIVVKGERSELAGKERIKIDPAKKYIFSADAKLISGSVPSQIFLGFKCFDADGHAIAFHNVSAMQGTETELTAPVKIGDRVIRVKDASKWKTKMFGLHYNAQSDLSDLPSRLFMRCPAIKMTQNKDDWAVELSKPATRAIPAGVKVRQIAPGGFFLIAGKKVSGSGTVKFKGIVSGVAVSKKQGMFYAGTAYVKPQILVNWGAKMDDNIIEISNIKLEVQ